MALLEVESLSIRAGQSGHRPVRNVSFNLEAGERLAIIGRSGAGKSVLATAIAGLLRPPLQVESGEVRMKGKLLVGKNASVFYLFQNPGAALSPCIRIVDQVKRTVASGVNALDVAEEALATVGLRNAARQYPFQLSGGMRQRVLIAMALVIRPMVLIADEPTTGQDPVTQAEILDCLDRSLLATGAALLFITHDVRAAARMCPRALVMDRGQMGACSTWGSLGDSHAGEELFQAIRRLGQ
jgi:peptide/nickel transport system ATP-binding protein